MDCRFPRLASAARGQGMICFSLLSAVLSQHAPRRTLHWPSASGAEHHTSRRRPPATGQLQPLKDTGGTIPNRPPPPPALTRVRGRGNENPRAGATAAGQGPPPRGAASASPTEPEREADNNGVAVGPHPLVAPGCGAALRDTGTRGPARPGRRPPPRGGQI